MTVKASLMLRIGVATWRLPAATNVWIALAGSATTALTVPFRTAIQHGHD